jgi:hypothetical protein
MLPPLLVAACLAADTPPPSVPAVVPKMIPFMRGMGFAHVHAPNVGYGSTMAKKELVKLRSLGIDWISISPFAYMPKIDEPELLFGNEGHHHGDATLTEHHLIQAIADAHALGIKVMMKPHLWAREFGEGKWQGDIKMKTPADTDAWFAHYTSYVVDLAKLASRAHADAFGVGVEYVQMTKPEHTSRWRQLIAAARLAYSGPITYCAHHGDEVFDLRFWDSLDWIGVDAYFPLPAELEKKDAPLEDISAAFMAHLEQLRPLADRYKKPIVLTELGYPSHAGAFSEPWKSDRDRPIDEDVQARGYEAALSAVADAPWVRGVFFWKWFSGGRSQPFEHDPYQPDGKEAEQVIKKWFAPGSTLRPGK